MKNLLQNLIFAKHLEGIEFREDRAGAEIDNDMSY